MIPEIVLIVAVALGDCLALAAAAFTALALWSARKRDRADREQAEAASKQKDEDWQNKLNVVLQRAENLASDLRDLESRISDQQAAGAAAGGPRNGLNLSKRAEALRMYRRGDAPDQIASFLELPSQEVDLLVKVHRIVLSNI